MAVCVDFDSVFAALTLKCLVQHANAATAHELFDVVDEEAVGGDHHVVGFEDAAELAGFFEIEQDLAFSGCPEEESVQFFQ